MITNPYLVGQKFEQKTSRKILKVLKFIKLLTPLWVTGSQHQSRQDCCDYIRVESQFTNDFLGGLNNLNEILSGQSSLLTYYIYNHLWQCGLWSFQTEGTKLERFLPKSQHTRRKLLNFENWVSGEVSKIGHHFSK